MAGVILQSRDVDLLLALFESRIMTSSHIATLFFSGSKEAAKKRLQKLSAAGLIRTRKRLVNEPSILFLTRKAFSLLVSENLLSQFPRLSEHAFSKRANVSALTIRHELEVMDVKTAFHSAIRTSEKLSAVEFSTWPRLNEFKAMRCGAHGAEVLVKPDGFIRIHEQESAGGIFEHTYFLEVDRSTEAQNILIDRVGCYLDYYKSGGFALRNGAPRSSYKDYPFRVLIVLKNAERRNNLAERLLHNNPPILALAYLSTFEEVNADPLGEIWMRPVDYREAVKGSIFEKSVPGVGYRRQAGRENLVQATIKKRTLF